MDPSQVTELPRRCDLLRALHRPGAPLLLPNAWDVSTARAVVSAGFPAVATTSGGVAATLGYEDHEGAPADEMLAAAARIARGVDAPVTVDAEAGYGLTALELVAALRAAGAAGCNLEDTDHARNSLRDPGRHAEWLTEIRQAASNCDYRLVINARVDVFVRSFFAGGGPGTQKQLVPDAVDRANAYLEAGADCVYPIGLWETDALRDFISEVKGPVNVIRVPNGLSLAELAAMGVARVSWASLLFHDANGSLPRPGRSTSGMIVNGRADRRWPWLGKGGDYGKRRPTDAATWAAERVQGTRRPRVGAASGAERGARASR